MAATALAACATPEPAPRDARPATTAPTALWFGGDVHLGDAGGGGLGDIRDSVTGAVGVVNLEGPVAAGAGFARVEADRVELANPGDAGTRLARIGVGAVSIANNHAEDAGAAGLVRTRAVLEAGGIAVAGAPSAAPGPDPGTAVPGAPGVWLWAYDLRDATVPARLAADLDAAAALPEPTLLVSLHVTGPRSYLPRPELIAAVDQAVEHGADVIVAHGTHVVGPVERRGDTVIAWGLGNLFFACACTREDEAVVLRVELSAGHPATLLPIRAGLDGRDVVRAPDAAGILDLVAGLGRTPLRRHGAQADF